MAAAGDEPGGNATADYGQTNGYGERQQADTSADSDRVQKEADDVESYRRPVGDTAGCIARRTVPRMRPATAHILASRGPPPGMRDNPPRIAIQPSLLAVVDRPLRSLPWTVASLTPTQSSRGSPGLSEPGGPGSPSFLRLGSRRRRVLRRCASRTPRRRVPGDWHRHVVHHARRLRGIHPSPSGRPARPWPR